MAARAAATGLSGRGPDVSRAACPAQEGARRFRDVTISSLNTVAAPPKFRWPAPATAGVIPAASSNVYFWQNGFPMGAGSPMWAVIAGVPGSPQILSIKGHTDVQRAVTSCDCVMTFVWDDMDPLHDFGLFIPLHKDLRNYGPRDAEVA